MYILLEGAISYSLLKEILAFVSWVFGLGREVNLFSILYEFMITISQAMHGLISFFGLWWWDNSYFECQLVYTLPICVLLLKLYLERFSLFLNEFNLDYLIDSSYLASIDYSFLWWIICKIYHTSCFIFGELCLN